MKTFKLFIFLFLFLPLGACQTTSVKERISVLEKLHHSVPNSFGLKFVRGYKEVDLHEYYYESARWASEGGTVTAYTNYTYLSDKYVYASQGVSLIDLVKSHFEDRVTEIGTVDLDREDAIKVQADSLREGRYTYVNFRLENAICTYFRKYIPFGSNPDVVDGQISTSYLGDAKLNGYICNHNQNSIPVTQVKEFIASIETKRVRIYKQL